jgi:hypothetical protein
MRIYSIIEFKFRCGAAKWKSVAAKHSVIKIFEERMKKPFLTLVAAVFLFAAGVKCETAPLKLVQTIKLPDEIKR